MNTLRELQLRPAIAPYDLTTKIKTAKRLLTSGDELRVVVLFRGRESTHSEIGMQLLQRVIRALSDVSDMDGAFSKEARRISVVLSPRQAQGLATAGVTAKPKPIPPTLSTAMQNEPPQ